MRLPSRAGERPQRAYSQRRRYGRRMSQMNKRKGKEAKQRGSHNRSEPQGGCCRRRRAVAQRKALPA